jgi:hypothetical protein
MQSTIILLNEEICFNRLRCFQTFSLLSRIKLGVLLPFFKICRHQWVSVLILISVLILVLVNILYKVVGNGIDIFWNGRGINILYNGLGKYILYNGVGKYILYNGVAIKSIDTFQLLSLCFSYVILLPFLCLLLLLSYSLLLLHPLIKLINLLRLVDSGLGSGLGCVWGYSASINWNIWNLKILPLQNLEYLTCMFFLHQK